MKNKVIAHLDQYRDKTLSEGCKTSKGRVFAVFESEGIYKYACRVSGSQWSQDTVSGQIYLKDQFEIIGHPITHADLLRALPTARYLMNRLGRLTYDTQNFGVRKPICTVPLNYPNVEAIPSDHPMWEQLGKVFNLTTPNHE